MNYPLVKLRYPIFSKKLGQTQVVCIPEGSIGIILEKSYNSTIKSLFYKVEWLDIDGLDYSKYDYWARAESLDVVS